MVIALLKCNVITIVFVDFSCMIFCGFSRKIAPQRPRLRQIVDLGQIGAKRGSIKNGRRWSNARQFSFGFSSKIAPQSPRFRQIVDLGQIGPKRGSLKTAVCGQTLLSQIVSAPAEFVLALAAKQPPSAPCANNTVPGKAEGDRNDRCPKALAGPPEEGRRLGDS